MVISLISRAFWGHQRGKEGSREIGGGRGGGRDGVRRSKVGKEGWSGEDGLEDGFRTLKLNIRV